MFIGWTKAELRASDALVGMRKNVMMDETFLAGKMVKLGNNFTEKNNVKVVSEDGFDTIPLITPLDASQLQFPPPDKAGSAL